jgi:putative oxidoreductase
MDKAPGIQNATLDNIILLAGRLLLAWIFVHEGVFLAANFDAASAGMTKIGVPALALIPTIALQLVAGIAIAVGWHARLGAAALGLFCLATAILFHTNFANRNEVLHFEKDLAIAGGMFVLMLRGAGGYSVDAHARQKARHDDLGTGSSDALSAKLAMSGRASMIQVPQPDGGRPDRETNLDTRRVVRDEWKTSHDPYNVGR